MDDSCVLEKMDDWDVIENVYHEPFVRNRYSSLRNIVQEECDNDHVAHLQVRYKGQSKLNKCTLIEQDISRPCYYILRLIGLWQPANACCFFRFYHYAAWLFWLGAIIANIMLSYRGNRFQWGIFVNSLTTSLNLGCPFLFCRFYFYYGNYDQLVLYITNIRRTTCDKVKLYSRICTWISILLWILGGLFFYFHWIPLFRRFRWTLLCYILYGIVVFLTTGWWACWLSFYGFVCHLHKFQIDRYCRELNVIYGYSDYSEDIETTSAAILLDKFHDIRFWLARTNKDFNIIISGAIFYHFLDLLIFTVAYWKHEFGDDYVIWHYIGGVAFDTLSILVKLYPAATVGQALHNVVVYAGEHCHPKEQLNHLPKERFIFYRYVALREESLGLHVLGVKITSKLTVGFVMTFITAGLTFLKYAIPFIENLKI